jgi:hypothetical protein
MSVDFIKLAIAAALAIALIGYIAKSLISPRFDNDGRHGSGDNQPGVAETLEFAKKLMNQARAGNIEAVTSIITEIVPTGPVPPHIANLLSVGLFEAAAEGHYEIVQLLVDHGANMDRPHASDGSTAMGIAAFAGRDGIVQFLTRRAADVNARNHKGATPTMLAAAKCSAETLSIMINAGADMHLETNDELTILDFASMPIRSDIIKLIESAPESGH